MNMNPLFATDDDDQKKQQDSGYVLPNRHGRTIKPLHDNIKPETVHPAHHNPSHQSQKPAVIADTGEANPAVDLIRRKLETLFAQEPNASAEVVSVQANNQAAPERTRHQQFMHDLSTSGKSLAEIQTAWHQYYAALPDAEKHAVWQEFYANNSRQPSAYTQFATQQPVPQLPVSPASTGQKNPDHYNPVAPQAAIPAFPGLRSNRSAARSNATAESQAVVVAGYEQPQSSHTKPERRSVATIKKQIKKRVNISSAAQTKAKQHLKSLVFGLGSGGIVVLVVLFGLFNEVVLAPFIQPNRQASATPIILSTDSVAPSATPEVIIPKTSVQIPVDYTLTTGDESTFQKALESAVVHYPSTSKPGEKGNTAIFGHSSNNIFNPGKYKFAFVKLRELVPGDIFYLTNNGKVYSYKVYDKRIVPPSDTSVLDPVPDKTATATLITCDPPGTSLNRLVVWGEQVSPDPNANTDASAQPTAATQPTQITGNGPSLWKRLTGWLH